QLGRNDEAAEYWKKALSLMDRMSERERYRTLGSYYLGIARNYNQAVEHFTKLVTTYPSDRAGHNNLAIAYFNRLELPKALDEQRKALAIYKGSLKFRNNYALYAMYGGDFAAAIQESTQLVAEDKTYADAYVTLGISLLAQGDRAAAMDVWRRMSASTPAETG